MNLEKLSKEIHANAVAKGFYEASQDVTEKLMLIVSEFGEALEAHRSGKFADLQAFKRRYNELISSHNSNVSDLEEFKAKTFNSTFKRYVKDTVEDELADVVIRALDFIAWVNQTPITDYGEDNGIAQQTDTLSELMADCIYEIVIARNYDSFGQMFSLSALIDTIRAYCTNNNIDLKTHIELKMQYNASRPRLHGKNY